MRKMFCLFVIICSLGLCACGNKTAKDNLTSTGYPLGEIDQSQITDNQEKEISRKNEQVLKLDNFYERKDHDFIFQYPSQWEIKEEPWWPATETIEASPEIIVNIIINDMEKIEVFDSQSIDGGLFSFVSGEETEIINVLDIKGTMITETIEIDGEEPQIRVLAYYEDGYANGIGMGGSYGACAVIRKETYEQYRELIVELFRSVHMKQE